jgi:hypothetical protein
MPKVEQFPYVISEVEETRIADTPKQQGNDNKALHSVMFQQVEVTIERSWTGGSSIGFSFEEDVPMDNGYKLIWNMKSEWDSQLNKFLPYDAGSGRQGTASDALTWVEGDKVKVALSRRDYWHKGKQESTPKGVIAFGRKVGGSDAQPSEETSAPVAARPSASSTKTSILKGMGFNNISTVLGAAIINDLDLAEEFLPMWREAVEHAVRGEEVFQVDDPELLEWSKSDFIIPKEQGTLGDMLNDSSATEVEVPVTGAAAEGSLQEASGQIIQNIFNEDVVNLADVPVTTPSPELKDYMIASKELLHEEYGADGAAEASQWLADNVGMPTSFANEKAYWFAAYLKLTSKN